MAKETSLFRPTDNEARALARELVRAARFGALATLEPGTGVPLASRVALATDLDGAPVMLVSTLAGHTAALIADARCSLLVGEPGKGDPLAHPRLTLFGRADRLERGSDTEVRVRRRYLARHPKAQLYADFDDFSFFRVTPERGSLNGGFGKAYALMASDLVVAADRLEGFAEREEGAVAHMNADHGDAIALYARAFARAGDGAWTLTALDPDGLDLAAGDRVVRVAFDPPLNSFAELRPRLVEMARRAREGG